MMPNVTKGDRMVGLINYLVAPGRTNEHRDQRLIAASESIVSVEVGQHLDAASALALGREMDIPKSVFGGQGGGQARLPRLAEPVRRRGTAR